MRKVLLLSLGGFVGYVLGARAGRPAYDRLVNTWSGLSRSAGLGDLTASVRDAAVDVRDTAIDKAQDAVSATADEAKTRLDATATTIRSRTGSTGGGTSGTPVADGGSS